MLDHAKEKRQIHAKQNDWFEPWDHQRYYYSFFFTLVVAVLMVMPLGIMRAVIFFSISIISSKLITNYKSHNEYNIVLSIVDV